MKHIVFVGAQLLALLPMLIWYFTACKQESVTIIPPTKRSFDSAFLKGVVLGPIGIVILLLIATDFHVRDMWATPFWSFAGLALIYFFPRTLAPSTLKRFSYGLLTVALFGIIGFVGNTALGPYFSTKPQRVHFPGQQIALQINNAWHQRYKTPLSFVIGDIWSAGNVSYYTSDRPHVFIDSNKVISPWINTDEVAKKGAVIVWCEQGCNSQNDKQPDYVATQYPNAEMQEPIVLSRQTKAPASEVKIGWALLPPTAQ